MQWTVLKNFTSDYILKIALCMSLLLVFVNIAKSDTAQFYVFLKISSGNGFWDKYFSSPLKAIIIKEKLRKSSKKPSRLQFHANFFLYITFLNCILPTENRTECMERLPLLLYFVDHIIQDQWIVLILLGDSIIYNLEH